MKVRAVFDNKKTVEDYKAIMLDESRDMTIK